jgi:hypothetical protein
MCIKGDSYQLKTCAKLGDAVCPLSFAGLRADYGTCDSFRQNVLNALDGNIAFRLPGPPLVSHASPDVPLVTPSSPVPVPAPEDPAFTTPVSAPRKRKCPALWHRDERDRVRVSLRRRRSIQRLCQNLSDALENAEDSTSGDSESE